MKVLLNATGRSSTQKGGSIVGKFSYKRRTNVQKIEPGIAHVHDYTMVVLFGVT